MSRGLHGNVNSSVVIQPKGRGNMATCSSFAPSKNKPCTPPVVALAANGQGSTVNVCLLDLSKAFDKMNHFALYIKLMNRSIPVQVLSVLENWFSSCLSCVKWDSVMSYFYVLKTGVRQLKEVYYRQFYSVSLLMT